MKKDIVVLFMGKSSQYGLQLPYVFLYLERNIRDLGMEIILLDEALQPDYLPLLLEKRDRILLAGVSALTGDQIRGGITFSKKIREICDAPIVWGGWHPTSLPEQTLTEPYIDFVIVGRGERPFRQLIERLRDGRDISDIAGLYYKRGAAICVNPPGPLGDMNALPPINWNLIDLSQYTYEYLNYVKRCLPYFASHGCPFHCTFCSVAMVYNRHWYHKPVAQIIEDLQSLKKNANLDSVAFEDNNFLVNVNFSRELARAMIDAKLNLKWKCGAHPRIMTEKFTDEDIKLLAQSGCWRIYIGAESGDQEVLDLLNKQTKVEQTFRFIEMLEPHGIIPRLSTMVCFPTNPERDIELTIDMIGRAKLKHPSLDMEINFYTPNPGTELYEKALQKGFDPPHCLEDWSKHTWENFSPPWAPKGSRKRVEMFKNCYFHMMNPYLYRIIDNPVLRAMAYLFNKCVFPLAWSRFKLKFYRLPVEAIVFTALVSGYKKMNKLRKKALAHIWQSNREYPFAKNKG